MCEKGMDVTEKNVTGSGEEMSVGGSERLGRVVRKDLPGGWHVRLSPGGCEGPSYEHIWWKNVTDRGKSQC